MTDYSLKRSYRGEVLVAPVGADPVEGEWVTSRDRSSYFKVADHRKDVMKYSRSSKAGEHLKGGGDGLAKYMGAMAAIGVLLNDEARFEIDTLINEYNGDPYYGGNERGSSKSGKSRLLDAVALATKTAGSGTRAARGTNFHKLGEMINKGETPRLVQPELQEALEHYKSRVAPVQFLAQEILLINDVLQRAGSTDYLMELPAGQRTPDGVVHTDPLVVVGDLKTGLWDARYPAGMAAQLAAYGKGCRYNQETNERTEIHPGFNSDWGVLVHYPLASDRPVVDFYWVDLNVGMHAAMLNNRIDSMISHFNSQAGKPVKFEPTEVTTH